LVNSLEGAMFRLDVETGAEQLIPTPIEGILDATISPDGKTIAFSVGTSESRDANDIWVVDEKGSGLRRLVAMPYLQNWPTWSRDGRWIYFLSTDGGERQDVWRVSIDGKSREQVSVEGLYQFDVATGPGELIAFSSNRSGNYEIWTQKGSDSPRQVTDHPAVDGGPAWNADGTALIFESARDGVMNLWYVDLVGDGPPLPRQLTHHEGGARGAVWWHPPASR
jgi:Tol biopolymer transport system component